MAKRDIKRNGRGQIVSYQTDPLSYGDVLLTNEDSQVVEKYNQLSFRDNVDSEITEFFNNNEYEIKTEVKIPIPGLLNRAINLSGDTKDFVNTNPFPNLGFVASVSGNGGTSGAGGS